MLCCVFGVFYDADSLAKQTQAKETCASLRTCKPRGNTKATKKSSARLEAALLKDSRTRLLRASDFFRAAANDLGNPLLLKYIVQRRARKVQGVGCNSKGSKAIDDSFGSLGFGTGSVQGLYKTASILVDEDELDALEETRLAVVEAARVECQGCQHLYGGVGPAIKCGDSLRWQQEGTENLAGQLVWKKGIVHNLSKRGRVPTKGLGYRTRQYNWVEVRSGSSPAVMWVRDTETAVLDSK